MTLMEKMMKAGAKNLTAAQLSTSKFFNQKDPIVTDLPILNVAFSGRLDGGLVSGLTVLAGPSKSFKTMLGLYCLKAYLDKYKDGIAILYDSEFGITPEYIESFGIDTSRILHVPIPNIEDLKFDIMNRLDEIGKGDNVFILIDSIGNLASKKEVEDALNEKSVADMTRAKQLKSLFRMVTPIFTMKNIPCVAINHVYSEQGLYPKDVVSGGTGVMYSANTVFIIKKRQVKDGTDLSGWEFVINIEKSRFVREKAKLVFTVLYGTGIKKWSSLFDLAIESGHIRKASTQGWYNLVDLETGEILEPKRRAKDIDEDDAFFTALVKNTDFNDYVMNKYQLTGTPSGGGDEEEEE